VGDASPDIVEALKRAVAAVEAAGVPDDLREAAFKAALGDVPVAATQQSSASSSAGPPSAGNQAAKGSSAALAQSLKIDIEAVDQIYDVDEDGVHLVIQRSRLDETKKKAQQEIAYLALAARRVILSEEWTPIGVIADLAQEMGVHDSNFSKGIAAIGGDGVRIKGDKSRRELKINQVGLERASAIIARITESTS
jgi:hypothetical protein